MLGGRRSQRTFTSFTIFTFLLLVRKKRSVPFPNLELLLRGVEGCCCCLGVVVVVALGGVAATGLGAGKQGGAVADEGTGVEVEGAEEEAERVVGDSDDAESEDDDDEDDDGDEVDDDEVDDDDDDPEDDDDDVLEVDGEFKSPAILSGDVGLPLSAKAIPVGTSGVSSSDVASGG
jgi:hypothetical protein